MAYCIVGRNAETVAKRSAVKSRIVSYKTRQGACRSSTWSGDQGKLAGSTGIERRWEYVRGINGAYGTGD